MEFSQTVLDLKAMGYEFIYVGSSYPPLIRNRLADRQFTIQTSRQFEKLWLSQTVLPALLSLRCLLDSCSGTGPPFAAESAAETDERIAFLIAQVGRPGPTFVFAHWLLPHGPFRFDASCGHRQGPTADRRSVPDDSRDRANYLDQIGCTNRRILELVDSIRSKDGEDAVILLQADHGHGRFPSGMPTALEDATPDQVQERFDVFAAYAAPKALRDSLAAQHTPVNLLRTLFRVQWGVDEPPVEDRFYWSNTSEPLRLTPVEID
jgi:hypothetical protein